jgi:FKBP-type peptidyl-prolyl cis-trans isomerase
MKFQEKLLLIFTDLKTCDLKAMKGQMVVISYTGTLENGTKFMSDSRDIIQIGVDKPFPDHKGLEAEVLDMCIGEKRRVIVVTEVNYAVTEFKNIIPGGSTLYYDIELVEAFFPKVEPYFQAPNFSELEQMFDAYLALYREAYKS